MEPAHKFEDKYQAGIIKVAAVVKGGSIPVRIFNPLSEEIKVWKGSTVGKFCPIVDEQDVESEDIPIFCYHLPTIANADGECVLQVVHTNDITSA